MIRAAAARAPRPWSPVSSGWSRPAAARPARPAGRVGSAGVPGRHMGLVMLVELLTLITSLALIARSRAWVVFRWVGVAAPAQRRVWGMAHRMAGRGPARRDDDRGGATARMLRHNGSACGFSGLSEMAASPLQRPGRR